MADYNIYIHAIGTGGGANSNPTIPWSQREQGSGAETEAWGSGSRASGSGSNFGSAFMKTLGFAQNPDSIVANALSTAAKVLPIVATAYAVVKLGVAITDTVLDFSSLQSGDYREQVGWNNFKTNIHNLLHPFSSSIEALKTETKWRVENYKRANQRELLGDSVLNSYTNRGV